jgi:DNA-directed RNA polymerase omega subunit
MNNVIIYNKFLKVLISAQRARQIHKGARPLVRNSNARATRIAIEEVERGLISFDFISKNQDLKSEGDNRDVSGHDYEGGVNREVIDQLSVSRLLSVERLSD